MALMYVDLRFDESRASVVSTKSRGFRQNGGIEVAHFAHHSRSRLTPKTMSREQSEHNDLERRTLIERPRHIVKNIGLLLLLSLSLSLSLFLALRAIWLLLPIYFSTESVIEKRLCKPSSATGITYVISADLSCYRISRCETRAKFFEPDIGFCLDLCVLLLKTNHYIIAFIIFFCW